MSRADTYASMNLYDFIETIPDFPVPGVMFRDITPLLMNPRATEAAVKALSEPFRSADPDVVVGVEARGFIFGALVASYLGIGFAPVRKEGKLPRKTYSRRYSLEYGEAALEIHADAFKDSGGRVLFIDDVLATGGTAAASLDLIAAAGGNLIGAGFLIELEDLNGRKDFPDIPVFSVIKY